MSGHEPIRILYMEDDPGLARLVQKRLESSGYHVDVAADGEQGIARVGSSDPYDLLIVDQNMPVYSGLQVIQILGTEKILPATIMLTGSGNEETAVEAMKLGASDYVVKDTDGGFLDLLPAALDRVLEKRRLVEERRAAEEALVESEARFRAVAQTAVDAIVSVDCDGRITFWNDGAATMFAYDTACVAGRPLSDLVRLPRHCANNEESPFQFSGKQYTVRGIEAVGVRSDNSTLPIDVSLTSWKTRSGTFYTAIIRDVTERKAYEAELAHMAHHDALTGAYNRHSLAHILEREVARAKRYHHPIGFLMIDANRFKQINDKHGHEVGDSILCGVVDVISRSIREVDIVVRYGGDEFLVILPETDGKIAVTKQRIQENLAERTDLQDVLGFPVTLSIGCAHWMPDDPQPIDKVLDLADKRMYDAKRSLPQA